MDQQHPAGSKSAKSAGTTWIHSDRYMSAGIPMTEVTGPFSQPAAFDKCLKHACKLNFYQVVPVKVGSQDAAPPRCPLLSLHKRITKDKTGQESGSCVLRRACIKASAMPLKHLLCKWQTCSASAASCAMACRQHTG